MSNLVEQLRNVGWHDCNHHLAMEAAADLIESQQATINELVEALGELLVSRGCDPYEVVGADPIDGHPLNREGRAASRAEALLSKLKEKS